MWTADFDCPEVTQYWYCIKDTPFDISSLKSKRRYEINKGNKNFYTQRIEHPVEYSEALYQVYLESLRGYKSASPMTKEAFESFCRKIEAIDELRLFGVFDRATGRLCGYCDIYDRDKYLPIASLKTMVSEEPRGVNFALIDGVLAYFKDRLSKGSYLCDGARNVLHETQFQNFLEKYFGFRKAYCHLHVRFVWWFAPIAWCLYPFRGIVYRSDNGSMKKLGAVLRLYAWSRNKEDKMKCK